MMVKQLGLCSSIQPTIWAPARHSELCARPWVDKAGCPLPVCVMVCLLGRLDGI